MNNRLRFMQRAVELAEQARGRTSPNPNVGAVIVKDGAIIGEGWTQPYGFDHAEVQAIKNCSRSCQGAELYVTLEPCSHYGKTPPCADAIIAAGIKSVFIGIIDPNPLVVGKGIEKLKTAGIKVETGLMADVITSQLEAYLVYISKNRPFVFLKSALSLDGRIAAEDGSSRWISCEESRLQTHILRQEADAVLTGAGTIIKDDPLLNVRLPNPLKQPLRVVLDTFLQILPTARLVQTACDVPTLIFTSGDVSKPELEAELKAKGIELCHIGETNGLLSLEEVLAELHRRRITLLMLEAGPTLNTSFLRAGLVDKLYLFYAPLLLGGSRLAWNELDISNIGQALSLHDMQFNPVGKDLLITAYINHDKDKHI